MIEPDYLDADRLSAPGGQPALIVDCARWRRPKADIQAVVIGIDPEGAVPAVHADDFDLLLTASACAPRPWVSLQKFSAQVDRLIEIIRTYPMASTIAAGLLRSTETLSFIDALRMESLAYSTLLGGGEFARWRAAHRTDGPPLSPPNPVLVDRLGDCLRLSLNDADNRNAMSAAMRDALYETLANALDDPTCPTAELSGAGKCFSTGGSLSEFGSAKDLAEAHAVRTLRSCARALDALGERGTVRLHGACVGSGIEVAAAAHWRIAVAGAWFQLPELKMGLIPGAGGTATIARAIGRHRTLWMLLSAKRIGTMQALDWGLIHAIEDTR